MKNVLEQCAQAEMQFSAEAVHDLRTSLRRCRSLADGMRVFDRNPGWKKMRRAGKVLFSSLGELRDTQVLLEWVERLAPDDDPARKTLTFFLKAREQELKNTAAGILRKFDRAQWQDWASKLPARAANIPLDSPVFAHVALERWTEAHNLHIRALRNRTNVAFHDLRVGLKRLRYTVENFLPSLHASWGKDLKELQDALGEVHDLDVLWETAVRIRAFATKVERAQWRERIQYERSKRIHAYRLKMVGQGSLWGVWRAALPHADELRALGLERFRLWASFLDPRLGDLRRVATLALQLYDGLPLEGILPAHSRDSLRSVLHASALMHNVGRAKSGSGYHKTSARLIGKITPPLGWTASELQTAALVARYHRGALPSQTQPNFAALSGHRKLTVQLLAGILRLACACIAADNEHKITSLEVESASPVLALRAEGYNESSSVAERIAAARYLLELTYRRPILMLPSKEKARARAA